MLQRSIRESLPASLDNTYRPGEPVTRAQMAIFLDRAFQLEDSNGANRFIDVSPGMKAYQAILNVHASGIAFGYEDGKYRPEVSVTRGQFAAFLARALEPSFRGTPTFTVESVSGWEKGAEITNADIDTEWTITFNNMVNERTLYKNIYIVRERRSSKTPCRSICGSEQSKVSEASFSSVI